MYTVAIHLDASGGQKLLEGSCPPSVVSAYAQKYGVGINAVDSMLCALDTLFRASLVDPTKDFTVVLMLNAPMVLFVMLLESARSDKPYVAYAPLVFGILTQTITGAISTSLFWTLFTVQACYGGSRKGRAPISRTGVESAFLGVIIGYLIPTAWMMLTGSSLAIVLWNPFPIYVSIIQNGWLWYRSKAPTKAGLGLAQWALLFFSILGSITWIYTLLPYVSWNFMLDLYGYLPSASIPDPQTTTLQSAVLHMLQYDAIWMFASTLIAAVFLSEDKGDAFFALQTMPALVLLCGPAAVLGGLWIFRELQIAVAVSRTRLVSVPKPKTE